MNRIILFGTFTMLSTDKKTKFITQVIKQIIKSKHHQIHIIDTTATSSIADYPSSTKLTTEKASMWLNGYCQFTISHSISSLISFLYFCLKNLPTIVESIGVEITTLGKTPKNIINSFIGLFKLYHHYSSSQIFQQCNHVLIFGAYMPSVRIFRALALQHKLKIHHMEFSMLPGFITIDSNGLNSESWIVRQNSTFNRLPVSTKHRHQAKKYIQSVKTKSFNMKPQNQELPLSVQTSKPKIFVAGMEIIGGGISPRITRSSKNMSPVYKDNIDLLKQIYKITKGQVEIIYTPHPNMLHYPTFNHLEKEQADIYANTLIGYDAISLINQANIVITIGSSVGYLALIHRKPCILVGRGGLYGKKCCYEVAKKSDLKSQIFKALHHGQTKKQRSYFINYVARELNYNTYSLPQMPFKKYTTKTSINLANKLLM